MEVAEEIHISQAQVSRLEKNALKTMRGLSEINLQTKNRAAVQAAPNQLVIHILQFLFSVFR